MLWPYIGAMSGGAAIGLLAGLNGFCWVFGPLLSREGTGADRTARLAIAALLLLGGGALIGGTIGFRWIRRRSMMGLKTVEIVMDMEDYFHVQIPDAALSCITVADLQQVIVNLLAIQRRKPIEELQHEVCDGMLAVLAKSGYSTDHIRPESKWVGDITESG